MAPDIEYMEYQARTTEPKSTHTAERKALIRRLQGQKVLVPDIITYMPAWRVGLNPVVDSVNKELDVWLKTVNVEKHKKTKHRQRGNYTWLAAAYYSDAKKEKILLLAQFLYWVR